MTAHPTPMDAAVAPCRRTPERMFPPTKGPEAAVRRNLARARAVCLAGHGGRRCPSFDTCLSYALRHQVGDGVWAATTEAEREATRRKQGIKAEPLNSGLRPVPAPGLGSRSKAPHGSLGAIRAHERRHERLCDVCRAEKNAMQRARRAAS